jgi:phosphatidylglycerol:prolipoprotein diacylglycerol transferase
LRSRSRSGSASLAGAQLSAGLDSERILDVSAVILVSSIVGARALFVLTHPARFRAPLGEWTDAFVPLAGSGLAGLSMLGGVVFASAACLATLRARGLPTLRYADVLAPSVAFGEGITRIGCLLNGCCPGAPTSLPWGVRASSGPGFGEAMLHPTPLYLSLAAFGVFAALLAIARRARRPGTVFFAFLALSGLARLALDPLRAYETPEIAASNAVLAGALAALGLAGLARRP